MARGNPSSVANNSSIPVQVQRALRQLQAGVNGTSGKVAEQGQQLAAKLSPDDFLKIAEFVGREIQANGKFPLSLASLPGVAARPQRASVPVLAGALGAPGSLIIYAGQLYQVPTSTGGASSTVGGSSILVGTNAARLASVPGHYATGTAWFESDTGDLYVISGGSWVEVQAPLPVTPMTIGFVINSGTVGTDVGPVLVAPRAGTVSKCVVVTKASDGATALTFAIKQNGTSVFTASNTVTAGTAGFTVSSFTNLTASPLAVAAGDVFSIDISSGTTSWQFSAQLET